MTPCRDIIFYTNPDARKALASFYTVDGSLLKTTLLQPGVSALDIGAEMLVISQFTLFADAKKGRRPSFTRAAPPEIAEPLVSQFVEHLRKMGVNKVETGL